MGFIQLSGVLILCALACGISAEMDIDRGLNSMLDAIVPQGDDRLDENSRMSDASAADLEKGTDHKSAVSSDTNPDSDNNSVQQEAILLGLGLEPEKSLRRADMCSTKTRCTYEFTSRVDARSSMPDNTDEQFERSMNRGRLVVSVHHSLETSDDANVWDLSGQSLLWSTDGSKKDLSDHTMSDHTEEFGNCKLQVIQDKTSGQIRATVSPQNVKCPPFAMRLLMDSVHSLVPVITHTHTDGKSTFSHREVHGDDNRRVDSEIKPTGAGKFQLVSTTHHHKYSTHMKNTDPTFDDLSEAFHNQKSHAVYQIDGRSLTQHVVRSKAVTDPEPVHESKQSLARSESNLESMPSSTYGGEDALHQRKHMLDATVEVVKLHSEPVQVPTGQHTTQSELLEQARLAGHTVEELNNNRLPKSADHKEKKPNKYVGMTEEILLVNIKRLIGDVPMIKTKLAMHEASQMLENKHGATLMRTMLKNGHVNNVKASAVLVGSLGEMRPHPTAELLEMASNKQYDYNIKEQALWALLQPGCGTVDYKLALDDLRQRQLQYHPGQQLGLHTTRTQVQHVLVAHAIKCADKPETMIQTTIHHTSLSEESLLQALENEDWRNVNQYLVALANSKLERHTAAVKQALKRESLPDYVSQRLMHTLHKLDGNEAKEILIAMGSSMGTSESKLALTGYDKEMDKLGVKYEWKYNMPPDGKNGAPDPKFQAGAAFEAGAKVTSGINAELKFPIKIWKKEWTYDVASVKFEAPGFKPVLTICVNNCKTELYSWAPYGKNEEEEKEEEDDEADPVGRCETDLNSLKGLVFAKEWSKTFFEQTTEFMIGPFPCQLHLKIEGKIGFKAGIGILGGKEEKVCETYPNDQKKCSDNVKCGDGEDLKKGQLVFLRPEASVTVEGKANLGADGIVAAGVTVEVTLLEIKVPATLEANMGGTIGAGCTGLQVITAAGAGKVSIFVEAWGVGRKVWELFKWEGAEWVYPSEKTFIGSCAAKVGIPDPEPPKLLDPMDDECQVVFYNGLDGKAADSKYTYAVQQKYKKTNPEVHFTQATKIALPETIQDSTMSIKTFGNCYMAQLLDNDGWSQEITDPPNGDDAFMLGLGTYNFPYDLKRDVAAVGITTWYPKPKDWDDNCPTDSNGNVIYEYEKHDEPREKDANGKYLRCNPWLDTENPNYCFLLGFTYTDYVGLNMIITSKHLASSDISSFRLSRGCKRVWMKDNDNYGFTDDQSFYGSATQIHSDFEDDVAQFNLYPKTAAGAELSQVSKDSTKSRKLKTPPTTGVKQIKVTESGCWHCSKKGVADSMQCWKGQKTEVPDSCGKGAVAKIDPDCKCTHRQADQKEDLPKREEQLNAEICNACGYGYKKGSDKHKRCASECKTSNSKGRQSVCPKDCMYEDSKK